jgi:hypothetical protein
MITKTVVILTLAEVKEVLVQWYADMVVKDRDNVVDHIREGRIAQLVPNLNEYTHLALIEQFAELNLGDDLLSGVDQVLVKLDGPNDYVVVRDVCDLEPAPDDVEVRKRICSKCGVELNGRQCFCEVGELNLLCRSCVIPGMHYGYGIAFDEAGHCGLYDSYVKQRESLECRP